MNIAILIPAYEPDEELIHLLLRLSVLPFRTILVVDDGSSSQYTGIFQRAHELTGCRVIRHGVNKGKGAALKTGMRELLKSEDSLLGCITVDADGQHVPEDILQVAAILEEHSHALVLGCRDFLQKDVPFKSKSGNLITRTVFRMLTGKLVSDTQTGLRAIPLSVMQQLIHLPGERYEFEMNMLTQAAKSGLHIIETPIHTVYIEGNRSSHFHPLIDALRIYKEIMKFGLSSLICATVDIGVFAAAQRMLSTYHLSLALLGATAIARLCSSGLNFYLNKNLVFGSKGRTFTRAVGYYLLCIAQMLCSWMLLRWLTLWGVGNIIILKILVDTGLFFLSYSVQRVLIFGGLSHAKSV